MRPGHYLPTASWLLPTASWLLISLYCPVLEARQLQAGKLCGQGKTCGAIGECSDYRAMDHDHLTLADRRELNDNFCGFNTTATETEAYYCCDEGVQVRTAKKSVCGKRAQTSEFDQRIANGKDVMSPMQWPWMARLLYQKNEDDKDTTFCGGALVSQRHVVTAAHCVEDPQLGEPVAVVLGELDIRMEYDCLDTADNCGANGSAGRRCLSRENCAAKVVKVAVQQVVAHGSYNPKGGSGSRNFPIYDVAVLVLAQSAKLSDYIRPICLPDPSRQPSFDSPGQPLTVTGWGNYVTGRQKAKSAPLLQELRGLKETPLDNEEAEDGRGCRTLIAYPLLDHHMCIWKQGGDTANACTGDSGGPISRINRKNAFDSGTWDLAGVVSFGTSSACGSRSPLVVTRIEEPGILAWVKEQVGADMPAYP